MAVNNPSTRLTIAVGDIHGCSGKLDALLAACTRFAGESAFRFVFLGDYIDRGPDSRAVVERLLTMQESAPPAVICLKGNHEQMLEDADGGEPHLLNWLANGGNTTLANYQVDHPSRIPPAHRAWLASLPLYFDDGLRFFVHAGVDPFTPLDRQRPEVLLWVRDEFPDGIDTGRFIVHGHTPLLSGVPELRPHRLNLDTAAFAGGPLTAAVFTGEQVAPIAFINDSGAVTRLAQ